jgi:acyl carrier protein
LNLPQGLDWDLYERIVTVVAESIDPKYIEPGSRIHHDLGLDGMDAYDLMVKLQDQFDVDMTNFDFHMHFGIDEDNPNPVLWIYRALVGRNKSSKRKHKIPITIMDLYEAAKTKRWPDMSKRAGYGANLRWQL